jgi:hypothetical protein
VSMYLAMNGLIFIVLLFVRATSPFPALVGTAVHHYTGKHRFIPARPMKVALGPIFVLIMIRAGVNAGTVHNLIGI